MNHTRYFWATALGALCLSSAPGCGSRTSFGGGTDTSTDWLRVCERDAQCGSALSCSCGVCAEACSSDDACADFGTEAVCVPVPQTCGAEHVCAKTNTFEEPSTPVAPSIEATIPPTATTLECVAIVNYDGCCAKVQAVARQVAQDNPCMGELGDGAASNRPDACPAPDCSGVDCIALTAEAYAVDAFQTVNGDCELSPKPALACDPRVGCANGNSCVADTCNDVGVCLQFGPGVCDADYAPICGCDGLTYGNECELHGAPFQALGECSSTVAAPPLAEPLQPLEMAGLWETSSFEDPLVLDLAGTAAQPSARICSITVAARPTDPSISLAQQILDGTNCDANPVISIDGQGLLIAFVIPWKELGTPLAYEMTLAPSIDSDTLSGTLRSAAEGAADPAVFDLLWTRASQVP